MRSAASFWEARSKPHPREIARDSGPASKTLRNLVASVERLNSLRFHDDRKLHDLLQMAYDENWLIVREHSKKMDKILVGVICQGMAAGEFRAGDAEACGNSRRLRLHALLGATRARS